MAKARTYNIMEDLDTKGPPTLEIVKWVDHASTRRPLGSTWKSIETVLDIDDGLIMFSVGWVVRETEDALVLIAHGDRGSNVDGDITIMKPLIIKRWKLVDPSTPDHKGK